MFSQRQRPISAPVLRGHLTKAGETERWVLREGEASSISAQGTSLGSSPSPVTSLLGKLSWSVSSLNQKLLHVCCYEGQRRTEDAENCPPLRLLQLKYKALSSQWTWGEGCKAPAKIRFMFCLWTPLRKM